jgi:hypothetical protein
VRSQVFQTSEVKQEHSKYSSSDLEISHHSTMSSKVLFVVLFVAVFCSVARGNTTVVGGTTKAVTATQVKPQATSTRKMQPTLKSVNGTVAPTKARTTNSASSFGISSVLCAAMFALFLL